jgi:hypothetical protein
MSAPQVKGFNCPSCGAPVVVRGMAHTLSVVCGNCQSILDAKDPNFRVLQKFQAALTVPLHVPLGSRGKIAGSTYEVIGFQVRSIEVDDVQYSWAEYLLFNPYQGFRYLTEYQGHWNNVTTLRSLPEVAPGTRPSVKYGGELYQHFQSAQASTTYVLGEFPWQVQVGDKISVMDYVAPPHSISSEFTSSETVWSLGEYLPGKAVWEAFKLPGGPPRPQGVYANQPSPFKGRVGSSWIVCLVLLALLFLGAQFAATLSANERVFAGNYSFIKSGGEPSFVTNTFALTGRPSTVELDIRTDLANNWAYFNFALINAGTGEAWDFGREVSSYSGSDSDGAWSEGSPADSATIPTVPAGDYYLRVEPDTDSNAPRMYYSLELRRDVPVMMWFWFAALAALIPPIFTTFRSLRFERRRWAESDYAPSSD